MGWTLPKYPAVTFERNTLALVVMQLRFQPILKIAEPASEGIAEFQDRVRPCFPGYESVDVNQLEIGPTGVVNVRNERAHRFMRGDGKAVLSLGASSLAVEYKEHKDRAHLLSDVRMALAAFELYAPVLPVRLGLRYVNIIQRKRIGRDLQREVAWSDLLTKEFASVPGTVASFDESTHFLAQVSASHDQGKMTLRYGLPGNLAVPGDFLLEDRSEPYFRVDTDRFLDESFSIEDVPALLEIFSADVFDVFMAAAGPVLLEWMGLTKARKG